ncbi:MAG TPA: glycoside hydrolase family 88 protein [Vicinamibacteria bacterium]|nr:glycoside hydrolase family 88 protein [Vicinamibacteria bacterium]
MRPIAPVLLLSIAVPAAAQPPSPAPSPDTRTIRDVVTAVAKFQRKPLEDGEYKRGTWEEVQANKRPLGLTWTYQYGVILWGLLRATDATGDKTFADFVADHNRKASAYASYLRWVDKTYGASQKEGVDALLQASSFRRFIRMDRLDFCGAMAHSMLESVLRHGVVPNETETEILDYVADYIQNKQGRIEGEGIFFRPEAKDTLWIDDLYMSCPFLVRRAKQENDPSLLDDAARQVKGFAKRQQDTDGLWYHAAWVKENRRSLYKWGRANGWAMVTTVEVLSALPESHPDRAALIDILRKHVEGVKKHQKPTGLWPQVLDHPELWDETSCSAMFAYAIARGVRRGWLPKEDLEIARKAYAGVMRNVTPDGQVLEVSEGTGIGETLEFYRDRKRPVNDHHGPGPVMFAGAELMEIDAAVR